MKLFGRARRRADDSANEQFSEKSRDALARSWYLWTHLGADLQLRLEPRIQDFVHSMRWETVRGFVLTEPMKVLIGAQASLLALELEPEAYRAVGSLIVHPTTVVLRGERSLGPSGIMTDTPFAIEGQARFGGPLILAWDAVRRDASSPRGGRNVVFHEFTHALDMLDRVIDGTPSITDASQRDRWIEVCGAAFAWLQETQEASVLRDYALTNPGEFFAVATESFFAQPAALVREQPQLYSVLRSFYQQDPLRYAANI